MCKKAVFLTDSDEIRYFDGRFLITSDEHVNYLAYKQRKKERKQLFNELRNYLRNRG